MDGLALFRLAGGLGRGTRQPPPELGELPCQFGIIQISQSLARDNHDVPPRQFRLVETKGFTQLPLDAIALNRELDALLADHQPDTGMRQSILAYQEQDVPARYLAGGRVEDCFELARGQQSLFPTEVSTHYLFRRVQTARRLRPLARRRDRTARPFLVAMRARKP